MNSIRLTACTGTGSRRIYLISLAKDRPDFKDVVEDYGRFLKPYQGNKAKVAYIKSYELRTNWKLIAENSRECYHWGPHILKYCNAVIGANLKESPVEELTIRRVQWQQKGLAINNVHFENDSFHFAVRYPLRPGILSYSLDGDAVARPMGDHKDFDAGVL